MLETLRRSSVNPDLICPSSRRHGLSIDCQLMRRLCVFLGSLAVIALGQASTVSAQTVFVNGFVIPGNTLDATNQPGANGGRFGFFSDIYYDPTLNQWWALSDRGPGGGLITYDTRLSRFQINVHPITGEISQFRVIKTIKFTDPNNLLARSRSASQWPQSPGPEWQRKRARPQLRSRRPRHRSEHG